MAIVEMKKLKLIGLSSDKDRILNRLAATGGLEIKPTSAIEFTLRDSDIQAKEGIASKNAKNTSAKELTLRDSDIQAKEEIASKYAKITSVIDFLTVQTRVRTQIAKADKSNKDKYQPPKKPFLACRESISEEKFENVACNEEEILQKAEQLLFLSGKLGELKGEKTTLSATLETLLPYLSMNAKFSSIKNTKNAVFFLGTGKDIKEVDFTALCEKYNAVGQYEQGNPPLLFSAVFKEKAEEFSSELNGMGFMRCPFEEDCTPVEKEKEIKDRLEAIAEEEKEITFAVVDYNKDISLFHLLSDHYRFGLEKLDADDEFVKTSSTFVMEGFVPIKAVEVVKKTVLEITNAVELIFEDVTPQDNPPTLCNNSALIAPFESVTNMYSVPSYSERDPNLFVAFFFFIFFGFMLSDAGYGLLLAIVGFIMLKTLKMEKGTKNLIVVLTLGGISTIIWGALFGGWFAIDENVKYFGGLMAFLDKYHLYWFKPLEQPIYMLICAVVLGVIQIVVGMAIHAVDLIKAGKGRDAFFDIFSWYILFIGIAIFAMPKLLTNLPQAVTTAGLVVLLVGVLLVMYGGSRKVKGVQKIIKAFGALYGIVNYISDLLSYTRLFGLGLATGVIGMVMNQLVNLLFGIPFVGFILGLVLFIFGHVFNLAINTLGAYVHNSRLQYIEFFSRFYEGGGHAFVPMGSKLQYTVINNQ